MGPQMAEKSHCQSVGAHNRTAAFRLSGSFILNRGYSPRECPLYQFCCGFSAAISPAAVRPSAVCMPSRYVDMRAFVLLRMYCDAFSMGNSATTDGSRSKTTTKEPKNIQSIPLISKPKGRSKAKAMFCIMK